MTRLANMYCGNPGCWMYGYPQAFRYIPAGWDDPGDWVEEPECRECHGAVHPDPPLVHDLMRDAADLIGDEDTQWTVEQRALLKSVYDLVLSARRDGK